MQQRDKLPTRARNFHTGYPRQVGTTGITPDLPGELIQFTQDIFLGFNVISMTWLSHLINLTLK